MDLKESTGKIGTVVRELADENKHSASEVVYAEDVEMKIKPSDASG